VHNPLLFLARERELAEEAWPGDIVGIPNHGNLRIGDALTEGEDLHFTGIPSFAPELLQRVRPIDPCGQAPRPRAAPARRGRRGASVPPELGNEWVVGVAGALQFEVLADRVRTEYDMEVRFESTAIHTARWLEAADHRTLQKFLDAHEGATGEDHDGLPVFLPSSAWRLQRAMEEHIPRSRS
jgi:peptide chain release factor 3